MGGQGPGQSVLETVLNAADMSSAVGRRSRGHHGVDDDDDRKSSMMADDAQRMPTGQGKLAITAPPTEHVQMFTKLA
jgi:hypothetical protein